jgi:hypothetical protein
MNVRRCLSSLLCELAYLLSSWTALWHFDRVDSDIMHYATVDSVLCEERRVRKDRETGSGHEGLR